MDRWFYMDNAKIVGSAKFKDGKLILPKRERNIQYRSIDEENLPITTQERFNKSYYLNEKLKSSTENEGQTLDLSKWKQENQNEWTEIRHKIEKNRKEK